MTYSGSTTVAFRGAVARAMAEAYSQTRTLSRLGNA